MNKEPVAWLIQTKTTHQFTFKEPTIIPLDAGVIPLYTHPVKEFNDGGEPVKNATYWKRQYNLMATQNDNLKSGLYHANEQIKYLEGQLEVAHQLTKMQLENSAPAVKELTDEEIMDELVKVKHTWVATTSVWFEFEKEELKKAIRAILRKAQEK